MGPSRARRGAAGRVRPLAEHSGLVRPLTLFVLDPRCPGRPVAPRRPRPVRRGQPLDPQPARRPAADDVARLLETGIPPSALTLEITESSIMADRAGGCSSARGPRRGTVRGRLRHRLLLARLPPAPPRQRGEDRPVVRAGPADRAAATGPSCAPRSTWGTSWACGWWPRVSRTSRPCASSSGSAVTSCRGTCSPPRSRRSPWSAGSSTGTSRAAWSRSADTRHPRTHSKQPVCLSSPGARAACRPGPDQPLRGRPLRQHRPRPRGCAGRGRHRRRPPRPARDGPHRLPRGGPCAAPVLPGRVPARPRRPGPTPRRRGARAPGGARGLPGRSRWRRAGRSRRRCRGKAPGPAERPAVLHDGGVRARYAKHHLPNYGVFDESRYFVPGDRLLVVTVRGVDVAVAICEDLWQEGGPVAAARAAGAGLLVVSTARRTSGARTMRDWTCAAAGPPEAGCPAGLREPDRRPGRAGLRRRLIGGGRRRAGARPRRPRSKTSCSSPISTWRPHVRRPYAERIDPASRSTGTSWTSPWPPNRPAPRCRRAPHAGRPTRTRPPPRSTRRW